MTVNEQSSSVKPTLIFDKPKPDLVLADLEAKKQAKLKAEADRIEKERQAKIQAELSRLADIEAYKASQKQKAVKKPVNASNNSSGNTYQPGQCVWGVKNWRPDIPNGWGSAYQWLGNARASGYVISPIPKVGAVGVKGNHVVLVIGVSGDSVTIREMNYNYRPYSVRTKTVPASTYVYIH